MAYSVIAGEFFSSGLTASCEVNGFFFFFTVGTVGVLVSVFVSLSVLFIASSKLESLIIVLPVECIFWQYA